MGEARWQLPFFAASVDVREQLNQPPDLALIRRGIYIGTGEPLRDSLVEVHEQHPELAGRIEDFDVAWRLLQERRWRDGLGSVPDGVLTEHQMQAILAHTLERPNYYTVLNDLLFNHQNETPEPRLSCWREFLLGLDTGLRRLRERERERQQPLVPLFAIKWIPQTLFDQYFAKDQDVVFKAPLSASTQPQVQFYWQGAGARQGKTPVLLEFQPGASRDAAAIDALSAVPNEDERLFAPFSRFRVVDVQEEAALFGPGQAGVRVSLRRMPQVPPLPAVMDWDQVELAKVLELAVIVAAHARTPSDDCKLRDLVLLAERAMCKACVPNPGARDFSEFFWATWMETRVARLGFQAYKALDTMCFINVSFAVQNLALLGSLLVTAPGFAALEVLRYGSQSRNIDEDQRARSAELAQYYEQHASQVKSLQTDCLREIVQDGPQGLFQQFRLALEQPVRVNRPELEPELEPEVRPISPEHEETMIRRWVKVKLQSWFLAQVVTEAGHVDSDHRFLSEFLQHVPDAEGFISLEASGRRWAHPVRLVLQAVPALQASAPCDAETAVTTECPETPGTPTSAEETSAGPPQASSGLNYAALTSPEAIEARRQAARRALAYLDLLRVRLARVRFVFPLGLPDAGKTTILKKAFGIRGLRAGLSTEGRTTGLTLVQCPTLDPNLCPVLVGDCPGLGDEVEARNDVVRLIAGLAADEHLKHLVLMLVVMKSGRHQQEATDELVQQLWQAGVPMFFVMTKADERFKEMVDDWRRQRKKVPSAEELSNIASQIKQEDQQRLAALGRVDVAEGSASTRGRATDSVRDLRPRYACFAGDMRVVDEDDDGSGEDEGEDGWDEKTPTKVLEAFHRHFGEDHVTPRQLFQQTVRLLGLED